MILCSTFHRVFQKAKEETLFFSREAHKQFGERELDFGFQKEKKDVFTRHSSSLFCRAKRPPLFFTSGIKNEKREKEEEEEEEEEERQRQHERPVYRERHLCC
jgi:hypothetical protein